VKWYLQIPSSSSLRNVSRRDLAKQSIEYYGETESIKPRLIYYQTNDVKTENNLKSFEKSYQVKKSKEIRIEQNSAFLKNVNQNKHVTRYNYKANLHSQLEDIYSKNFLKMSKWKQIQHKM
jgi:hypothetical protein